MRSPAACRRAPIPRGTSPQGSRHPRAVALFSWLPSIVRLRNDPLLEGMPSASKPRRRRPQGNAERIGNFRERKTLELEEHEDRALVERKLVERTIELLPAL